MFCMCITSITAVTRFYFQMFIFATKMQNCQKTMNTEKGKSHRTGLEWDSASGQMVSVLMII